jgi:hypothetical protein
VTGYPCILTRFDKCIARYDYSKHTTASALTSYFITVSTRLHRRFSEHVAKMTSSSKALSLLLIALLDLVDTQASNYIFVSCDDFTIQSADNAPGELNLDLTVDGLAVLGSDIVLDEALLVAARLTKMMSSRRPDLHSALIQDKVFVDSERFLKEATCVVKPMYALFS